LALTEFFSVAYKSKEAKKEGRKAGGMVELSCLVPIKRFYYTSPAMFFSSGLEPLFIFLKALAAFLHCPPQRPELWDAVSEGSPLRDN
jgi:hypothetical protein